MPLQLTDEKTAQVMDSLLNERQTMAHQLRAAHAQLSEYARQIDGLAERYDKLRSDYDRMSERLVSQSIAAAEEADADGEE